MPHLSIKLCGRHAVEFSPGGKSANAWMKFFEELILVLGEMRVFMPRCNFTKCIETVNGRTGKVILSNEFADGFYVTEPNHAIALFSVDCLTCVLFNPDKGHMATLHIGYPSLFSKQQEVRRDTIIDELFVTHRFPKTGTVAHLGWGIGSCCYGVGDLEIPGVSYSKATRRSRNGKKSLDLRFYAKARLLEHGIPEESIVVHDECTACKRNDSHDGRFYHSTDESTSKILFSVFTP